MKTLLLTAAVFCFQLCFAQTEVIAMRSHAGSPDKLHLEADNFGGPEITPTTFRLVDSIIYYEGDCIIQVYSEQVINFSTSDTICKPREFNQRKDTICNMGFFHSPQMSSDFLQRLYGESVKIIGFEQFDHPVEIEKEREENKEFLLPILFLLLLGPLFYVLRNIRSRSTALLLFILFTGTGITTYGQEIQIDKCGLNDEVTLNKHEAQYFQNAIDAKSTGPFTFEGKRILFLYGNYGEHPSSKKSFFEKYAKPRYEDGDFPHLQVIVLDEVEQKQLKGYDAIIISWSKIPVSTKNRKKFVKHGIEHDPNRNS